MPQLYSNYGQGSTYENYYDAELLTCAFDDACMFEANPCVLFGKCSVNANTMAGASLGLAGTPDVFGDV
tara:strand:- start:3 stop:209 length:207 start_codon:yes stop_codon:yes gene_type:complete